MLDFMDVAKAVEPVIDMLDNGGCRYASVTIFTDGSGHITVPVGHQDAANSLLEAHGVALSGSRGANEYGYDFYLDLATLRKYSETLCPHCGKDTEVPK